MSHFAKVGADGVVLDVIVAEQDFIDSLPAEDGISWVQTSFNTHKGKHWDPDSSYQVESDDQSKALRKNYAQIGGTYDSVRDAFIPIKDHDSWSLDEETCDWVPPLPRPQTPNDVDDDRVFVWDEQLYQSDNTQGWVVVPDE